MAGSSRDRSMPRVRPNGLPVAPKPAVPERPSLVERGIRPALVLGFALTIGTWLVAYWYFSARIASLEARQSDLSAHYQTAQDLLTTIRSDVLAASVAIRNTLLD